MAKKNIYVVYDKTAGGVSSSQLFCEINDGVVIRSIQEEHKKNPISSELANDLILLCLGSVEFSGITGEKDALGQVLTNPDFVQIDTTSRHLVGEYSNILGT